MSISASIVIFKTDKDEIAKAISSVVNSCVDVLYIVDNNPESDKESLENNPKIKYISGHGNIGYGAAHNIAIKKSIQSLQDYHVILNPDVEFEQGTIEKMLAYMDSNKDVGLITPKIFFPNGELQYLCKLLPAPFDWIGRRFIPSKIIKKRNDKFELRYSNYDKIMNVPYLSGCFMLFRLSVLKETGLFDERIFMYGEDTDITRRIHKKYKTLFFPEANIIHKFNKKSYSDFGLLWVHIKAAVYYFNKWGWIFDRERRRINKAVTSSHLS
jgi:GT2 family glycosyltransferase